MIYNGHEVREEECPHCNKVFQAPYRQLVTTPEDVYIAIPIYCPFCQYKAFHLFKYEEVESSYEHTDYIPCIADEIGSSIDPLLTMFEEQKRDCLELNKEEPLNLLELLEKQKEEKLIKMGYRLI